jgi:hypothetical protein
MFSSLTPNYDNGDGGRNMTYAANPIFAVIDED